MARIAPENAHDPYPFQFRETQFGNDWRFPNILLSEPGQPFHRSLLFDILLDRQNDRPRWIHYDFFGSSDSCGNTITPQSGGVFDPLRNKANLPEEDWELYPESAVGLPQGGYLSPLFSNVYLSMFDHIMLDAHFRLIRYADDFIVLCESIDEAEDAYKLTRDVLETRLGLELHKRNDADKKSKTRVVRITQTPIKFLGIQFDGLRIWPDPEKRRLFSNKLSSLHKRSRTVRELITSTAHLMEGWIAAYGFADLREIDVVALDDEVNKVLWKNLKSFEWKLMPKHLSAKQRLNSGVEPAKWYLDRIRRNLSERDRELLSKYWS